MNFPLNDLDDNWPSRALCRGNVRFTSYNIDDVKIAKSICLRCEVQVECILANAMNDGAHLSAGLSKYDRLILQWERARDEGDNVFRDSSVYISEVMRRQR